MHKCCSSGSISERPQPLYVTLGSDSVSHLMLFWYWAYFICLPFKKPKVRTEWACAAGVVNDGNQQLCLWELQLLGDYKTEYLLMSGAKQWKGPNLGILQSYRANLVPFPFLRHFWVGRKIDSFLDKLFARKKVRKICKMTKKHKKTFSWWLSTLWDFF